MLKLEDLESTIVMKDFYNFKSLKSESIFIALLLVMITNLVLAQDPPTTQDCLGAIPVCDYIYEEENTATGYGNYFEIPNGGNNCPDGHCMDGEKNSRWYVFTVVVSGDLRFQITPQSQSDDYDWAVFNISQYKCQDIYAHPEWLIASCNAAGYLGSTGISTSNGGTQDCNIGGNTNKWNADLPVYEGETYVLVVSDWTQTPGGYTLNFSTSTAIIFDDQQPFIDEIDGDLITDCGTNELTFRFNENVKCSSVGKNDFKLTGPGGPYTLDSIYGENCSLGGANEKEYTLYFTPAIYRGGNYTLEIMNLSFISDACNNYASPDTYDFEITLNAPLADAGQDVDIAYAGSTTLDGTATGGSGNYSYHWEPADLLDFPNSPNPTTVSLTSSTLFTLTVNDESSACVGEDDMWVNIVGGPLGVVLDASSTLLCQDEIVNLFAYPDGGSGNYSFSWTSVPSGFTSDIQNPSDFPSVTTTYKLEITDGITTINDEIIIEVNAKPSAGAGADQTINEGTSTTLEGTAIGGSGVYFYHWEPASFLVQNDIPSPQTTVLNDPVVFTLVVTDENGCESEPDNVLVNTEGPALQALPLADPPNVCVGSNVLVKANATGGGGDYTYSWTSSPTGFTSDKPEFIVNPEQTTRYDLLLTDQFGNEFTGHIVVNVNELPVIDLIPENMVPSGIDTVIVCVRDSVRLDAGFEDDPAGTIYFWNENYSGRYYKAMSNGNWLDWQTHTVAVENGTTKCKNSGKITLVFDFKQCAIGVPETAVEIDEAIELHPNPANGQFTLSLNQKLSDLRITIFDLSGRKVYEQFWDGKHEKGQSTTVDANVLENGLYIVWLNSNGKSSVKRIIVQ